MYLFYIFIMPITFSTCFYIIKSKFDPSIYIQWMNNLLFIVNEFNLVIYTDENTFPHIPKTESSRILVIVRPLHEFYNYKYKETILANWLILIFTRYS